MKDYQGLGLNPFLKKEGSLPLKTFQITERASYIPGDVTLENGGTINSPAIGTPTISGGNINNATIGTPAITGGTYNSGVFGTPTITGGIYTSGTFNSTVLGSPTITGGNYNTGTFAGTPVITGAAISAGTATTTVLNSNVIGSPTITGGNYNTGTFAGTPVITGPSISGGTASSFTFSNKMNVLVGANLSVGKGTLASGVATITTTSATTDSNVYVTPIASGLNLGILAIGTINAGTNFVVTSSNVLDSDSFNWWIIN